MWVNRFLSLNLFLLSPLYQNTGTKVKASPVKQTIRYSNASVITFSRIRILGLLSLPLNPAVAGNALDFVLSSLR
jgi:hypothetical protein